MSSKEEAARFFDAIARRYDRVYALHGELSRRRLARVLAELPPRARVLDLGVGTGRELSALLDAGHEPTGLDLSGEMLALCARRARPIPLVQADLWEALPFPDGSFDAAIALHGTLAHPPGDDALSTLPRELARVLGPEGVFVAEVPSLAWADGRGAAAEASGEMRLRRSGPSSCLHEDLVANVAIEATALAAERWEALFEGWADVSVLPYETGELLVVARRALR
jgi:ubiquinone/menaquinone biosynthesis C-methylase UbiE